MVYACFVTLIKKDFRDFDYTVFFGYFFKIHVRPVWIIGIEFHYNNSNLRIY
jgi:hypothetical protein